MRDQPHAIAAEAAGCIAIHSADGGARRRWASLDARAGRSANPILNTILVHRDLESVH